MLAPPARGGLVVNLPELAGTIRVQRASMDYTYGRGYAPTTGTGQRSAVSRYYFHVCDPER